MRRVSLVILSSVLLLGVSKAQTKSITISTKSAPATPMTTAVAAIPVVDDGYAVPITSIVAPEKPVKRGKNIVIGVLPLSDPKPKGLVSVTYTWVVSPKADDLFAWPDNTRASFGSGTLGDPDHYTVTLVASYVFADEAGKYAAIKTVETDREITVVDREPNPGPTPPPGPKPPPDPTPPPDPAPRFPNEKLGISTFTFGNAKATSMVAFERLALAKAYRGIANSIAAGALKTRGEVVNATVDIISQTLGASLNKWKPFLDDLTVEVNDSRLAIRTASDCQIAWTEIAVGLEAIK